MAIFNVAIDALRCTHFNIEFRKFPELLTQIGNGIRHPCPSFNFYSETRGSRLWYWSIWTTSWRKNIEINFDKLAIGVCCISKQFYFAWSYSCESTWKVV